MKWIKKGLIFVSQGNYSWNKSHAQIPVVDVLNTKIWRIYYATRDIQNQSRISYIEVKAESPKEVIYIHDKPILDLGKQGTFDDSGMMPSCIININNKKYLYYIGWNKRVNIPYHNSIGLAISIDNGRSFKRFAEGPIIDRTYLEPYFVGTAFVCVENNIWKMWYLSCVKWKEVDNKYEPFYHIKYAESSDGINWNREGIVAIDLKKPNEGGIASASVIRENNNYKMWYSFRNFKNYRINKNDSYRIGYAESNDGKIWVRKDINVGIEISNTGWDSEMIAYPFVIKHNNKKYMFYNGNGFGKTGFGYAVLENE